MQDSSLPVAQGGRRVEGDVLGLVQQGVEEFGEGLMGKAVTHVSGPELGDQPNEQSRAEGGRERQKAPAYGGHSSPPAYPPTPEGSSVVLSGVFRGRPLKFAALAVCQAFTICATA